MSHSDPTAEPVMPEWSAYAGEVINRGERRPLAIHSETDDAFVVTGFYYRAGFWKAIIPKRGVSEIIGQRFNFSKPVRRSDGTASHPLFFVNHVQARLRMRPEAAIRLHPLDDESLDAPAHTVDDFSYSIEAVGPFGRKWNTMDAMLGNLALVHRFLSTEDVAFERIVRERMTVLQSPPLPLEQDILDTMLCEAVRESSSAGLSRPYFMFRLPFSATNCTSEQLRLLDGVLRTPRRRRFLHRLPIHPRGYLKLRGLWQSGQIQPTLNEQMAAWLASDAAKQRREIHVNKKKLLPKGTPPPKVSLWRQLSTALRTRRSK